jgi:hypothetical protein
LVVTLVEFLMMILILVEHSLNKKELPASVGLW